MIFKMQAIRLCAAAICLCATGSAGFVLAAEKAVSQDAKDGPTPVAEATPAEKKAAETPTAAVTPEPGKATAANVAAQLKQVEALDADAPDRAKLIEIYRQAADDLKKADDKQARIAELEAKRIAVPYQLQARKRQTTAAQKEPAKLPADASLSKWDEMLDAAEQELEAAQKTVAAKDEELEKRAARRVEIPNEIASIKMKLEEVEQDAAAGTAVAEDSHAIAAAWRIGGEASGASCRLKLRCWRKSCNATMMLPRNF